jgi:hypothetical protein
LHVWVGTFNAQGILADDVRRSQEIIVAKNISEWHEKGGTPVPSSFLLKHNDDMEPVTKTDQRVRHSHLFEGIVMTATEEELRQR